MKQIALLLIGFSLLLMPSAQAQYQFRLKADSVGMFDAGNALVDSTVYYDWSLDYDLDQLASSMGMSQGASVFDWQLDLQFLDLDLSPVGINVSCCGLVGWDVNAGFNVGSSLYMLHQLDQGKMSVEYPLGLDIDIPDFHRGDVITITLDSTFIAPPQMEVVDPVITKDIITTFDVGAFAEAQVFLGPFGNYPSNAPHTFFEFDRSYRSTLMHVGSDGMSGDLGLVQNPALPAMSSILGVDLSSTPLADLPLVGTCIDASNFTDENNYYYDIDLDEDGVEETYESNLCWEKHPCLQQVGPFDPMDYWFALCKLRVPFLTEMVGDIAGDAVANNLPFFASESWYSTAPEVDISWPLGLNLVMRYPDDAMEQVALPAYAEGVLHVKTINPEPYFDVSLNFLDLMEDVLTFAGCPPWPFPPINPPVCTVQTAVDFRKTEDNGFLSQFGLIDDQGRVSLWNFMNSPTSTMAFANSTQSFATAEMSAFDLYAEYNIIDLETHFTITNDLEALYVPEVKVNLHFSEPVSYRLNSTDAWSISDVVEMPLEGEFQVATTCEQDSLHITPAPFIVDAPNMQNQGKDTYDTYLDITAANVNFGLTGFTLIPSFQVEFICADDAGDFFVNLGGCIAYALEWFVNGLCCVGNCAAAIFSFGLAGQCGGNCGCWEPGSTCETCSYGFPGVKIPGFDLAESLCQSTPAYPETGMCGFFWRVPFSQSVDTYSDVTWSVTETGIEEAAADAAWVAAPVTQYPPDFTMSNIYGQRYSEGEQASTGFLQIQSTGGRPPYTLEVMDRKDYQTPYPRAFELNDLHRARTGTSIFTDYQLHDVNGCYADLEMASDKRVIIPTPIPEEVGFCSDNDNDGCNDCASGTYNLAGDGIDTDGDGLCDKGDPDDDNDGILDGEDWAPLNPYACIDSDGDTCDDCVSGAFDPANDGNDTDGDGLCDAGESDQDNDGRPNMSDSDNSNPNACADTDNDGCDDCISGTFDPNDDGSDWDGDGLCDFGDDDADNDGRANALDPDDNNPNVCGDSDFDGCDDCLNGSFDPSNDGTDTDGDGLCDSGDPDRDGDGRMNEVDSHPLVATKCADTDGDECDDCTSGTFNPANDGTDFDGDGLCDGGDPDIDGDGVNNDLDQDDYNKFICLDTDGDLCNDCNSGTFNPNNDGTDTNGDGVCDSNDPDTDGDGLPNVLDPYPTDANACGDSDSDSCPDCSGIGTYQSEVKAFYSPVTGITYSIPMVVGDGTDTDNDGICDGADAFPNDPTEFGDVDSDGIGTFKDCDDNNPSIGAMQTAYPDADGDGFGAFAGSTQTCTVSGGWSLVSGDCNDSNPNVFPGASEICGNSADDDCDSVIDNGCPQ